MKQTPAKRMIMILTAILFVVMIACPLPQSDMQVSAETLNSQSDTWSENSTIDTDLEISGGVTVDADIILTIPAGKTLTVKGGIKTNDNKLTVEESDDNSSWSSVPSGTISAKQYVKAETPVVDVTNVTLSPTTADLIAGGDSASFIASVSPGDATNKKVKWSVSGTGVTLYEDEQCNNELTLDSPTDTLKVYAKGTAAGNPTITVTSDADEKMKAECKVTVTETVSVPYVDENDIAPDNSPVACTSVKSFVTSWGKAGETTWYAVTEYVEIFQQIEVTGTVNLILCDGATLNVHRTVHVTGDNHLIIWNGEKDGSGKLYANGSRDAAGIGGFRYEKGGKVTVNGGTVEAYGSLGGAGIGGGISGEGGEVHINGGTVIAQGGYFEDGEAAAIGGGDRAGPGSLTLYDNAKVTDFWDCTVMAGDRVKTCQDQDGGYAKIEPCRQHNLIYPEENNTSTTHTGTCKWCDTTEKAEDHTFQNGACTVCKYKHVHDWQVNINKTGNEATVTCRAPGCPDPGGEATLSAPGGVYNGKPFTATLNKSKDFPADVAVGEITYYDGKTKLDTVPVDAGENYSASVAVGNKTIRQSFAIDKESINPEVTLAGWTYGDKAAAPDVIGNPGGGTVTYRYREKDGTNFTDKVPTDAGDYVVEATVPETKNYQKGTDTAEFSIGKRTVTVSGITAKDKIYDGTTAATLDYSKADIDGVLEADKGKIAVLSAVGTFEDKNIGTNKKVTITEITLGGEAAGNYELDANGQQEETAASINPIPESAAEIVERMIRYLPDPVTLKDKEKVEKAKEAYDALTETQKKQVKETLVTKLNEAVDTIAALAIEEEISNLNDQITLDDKEAVDKAKEDYDALTEDQKAKVSEEALQKLEDSAAVLAIVEAIEDLPAEITVGDADAAYKAKADYDSLTDSQKEKFNKETLQKLDDAVDTVSVLKVEEMIKALPDPITPKDEEAVSKAVTAFNALTEKQQTLLSPEALKKMNNAAEAVTRGKAYEQETTGAKALKTKLLKVKNKAGRKVVVKWAKAAGVSASEAKAGGYQVRYSLKKNFKKKTKIKKINKPGATRITLKKLKKGKIYYIQVRPVTKVTNLATGENRNIYGKWSNKKKVRIKK